MDKNSVFYSYNLNENISDEELVSKSMSGDKHALEFLLEKYKELVNGWRSWQFFQRSPVLRDRLHRYLLHRK